MLLPPKTLLAARVRRGTLRAVPTGGAVRCRPTARSWDTSLGRTETPTFVGLRQENNKQYTITRANRALQTGKFPRSILPAA
jgi:hypothetical protein